MPIKINQSKEYIKEFLKDKGVGVLATCGKHNQPHAVAIYFFHDEELNIYFMTKEGTQKSRNLRQNPKASLAVYDKSTQTTLQAEGEVSIVEDTKRANRIFDEILKISLETSKSDLPVSKIIEGGYQACKFTPSSIRLASYQHPPEGDWQNLFVTV